MKKNYILKFFLLLVGIIFSSFIAYGQCTTCQYPGWDNYTLFTIDNTGSTETLTNYQVKVEFNTAELISNGEMNPDGSDIRVTLDCDAQPLDFWFDDINTEKTKLWVKISSIQANSMMEIFVHYGNKNATSESNASKVFELHQDFESGNLDDWSFENTSGVTWELATIAGENVLACKNPPGGNGTWAVLSSDLGTEDYIVELEFYAIADGNMGGIIFEHNDENNYLGYHLMTGSDQTMVTNIQNGSADYSLVESYVSEPNKWYDWTVIRKGSEGKIDVHVNDQLQRTLDSKYSNGAGIWSFGGGTIYYDNLFVRKYAKTEPVVTAYGVRAHASKTQICSGEEVTLHGSNAVSYTWDNTVTDNVAFSPSETKKYTVTGEDSKGCKTIATITVNATTVEKPIITAINEVLTSSSTAGNQWFLDGNKIDGAVNQTHTATQEGTYTVQVKEGECMSEISEPKTFTITKLTSTTNTPVRVVPNPAENYLVVENGTLTYESYKVVNIHGFVLQEGILSNEVIDISALKNGVYILVLTGKSVKNVRFIKE